MRWNHQGRLWRGSGRATREKGLALLAQLGDLTSPHIHNPRHDHSVTKIWKREWLRELRKKSASAFPDDLKIWVFDIFETWSFGGLYSRGDTWFMGEDIYVLCSEIETRGMLVGLKSINYCLKPQQGSGTLIDRIRGIEKSLWASKPTELRIRSGASFGLSQTPFPLKSKHIYNRAVLAL